MIILPFVYVFEKMRLRPRLEFVNQEKASVMGATGKR